MRICRRLKVLFAAVLLQFIFLASVAQTFTSVQTGPWENGATWGNNSPGQKGVDFPANNDNVIISSATTVSQSKKTAADSSGYSIQWRIGI